MSPASLPLDADEEALWRALAEVITTLPRALDEQFARATGVSMTEYSALVALSEAPGRELRMSELANATFLSLSRMSRVIDRMAKQSLVTRRKCPTDGRSSFAMLTESGLAALKAVYPGHLARVRGLVFDQLDESEVAAVGPVLARIAERLRRSPRPGA